MKIVKLVAENVKRLHCITVEPKGTVVRIAGKNSAGKSSVLDSIAYAMGGEKLVPAEPIRAGEREAKVVLDLGDLVVTRKFKRDYLPCDCGVSSEGALPIIGDNEQHLKTCASLTKFGDTRSTLTVTNKEGAKYPSPQAVLDKLLGKLTFDPLEFARLSATPEGQRQQDAILRRLVGLDVSAIEARRKEAFDRRAMAKKSLAIKQAQLDAMPVYTDAPKDELSSDVVVAELKAVEQLRLAAAAAQRKADEVQAALSAKINVRTNVTAQLEAAEREVVRLREALTRIESEVTALAVEEQTSADSLAAATAAVPNAAVLESRLKEVEATNARVRANKAAEVVRAEVARIGADVENEHAAVLAADGEKAQALAQARFPVAGLGVGDDGVLFNGVPFAQAGTAEQVRVSVAIGIALNPQLKVLLVRNGNLLDDDSLAAVAAQAEAADMQVWMEWVGKADDGVGVTLVDGEVA